MLAFIRQIDKEKVQKFCFLFFVFILPLSQKLSTICVFFLLGVSMLNIKKAKPTPIIGLLFPAILYFTYVFSLFYSTQFQFGVIEQKASLIIFPLIFFISSKVKSYTNLILKYFVFGCFVAVVTCEVIALSKAISFSSFEFQYSLDDKLSFYNSLLNDENWFFSYNFSVFHQTVYFSMYLVFAFSILIFNNIIRNKLIRNIILFALFMGVLQVLNKASLLAMVFVVGIKILQYFKKLEIKIMVILLFVLITVLSFVFNPRYRKFNKNLFIDESKIVVKDYRKIKNNNPNDTNFRVMLWVSAIELIKKNPILGIGAGGSHVELYKVFAVKRQWYDRSEKYHAHNQFLQIALDVGIVGFFSFLLMFFFLLRNLNKREDKQLSMLILIFLIIICVNFLFESMFERYSGISFFLFFYCLFVIRNVNPTLESIKVLK